MNYEKIRPTLGDGCIHVHGVTTDLVATIVQDDETNASMFEYSVSTRLGQFVEHAGVSFATLQGALDHATMRVNRPMNK